MILLDSSILVAAIAKDHADHIVVAQFYNSSEKMMIYDHSFLEAYRVLTFPNPEHGGFNYAARDAANSLGRLKVKCTVIGMTPMQRLDALAVFANKGIISARIYDAMIGHAGTLHGASAIMTLNAKHFRSLFPHMEIIDPSPDL